MTKDFPNLKSKVKINGCDIQVAVKNETISIVGYILMDRTNMPQLCLIV